MTDPPTAFGIGVHIGSVVRGLAFLCVGASFTFGLSACSTSSVGIVNDTSGEVRLSGCFIDDALDLKPSEVASQDVPSGRWGCSVYKYPLQPLGYAGCLVIKGGDRTYRLSRDIRTDVTSKECDHIG